MSGHSKWSTIKRKKAALDAKKGKAFSRLSKEISVAARLGGGDPSANSKLRLLIDKARAANMPMDNITRAIKRGTGEIAGTHYEAQIYEGYGPAGIAVIVETLSDNKNRTVADLRRIFSSKGGNLAETGSVNWMFQHLGVIRTKDATISEDALLEKLLEYDIKDLKAEDGTYTIYCDAKSLENVKNCVIQAGLSIETAELEFVASNIIAVEGAQEAITHEFLEELEDHDDVQEVYTNLG